MTIHDLFLWTATQRPADVAIADDAGETTFGSLSVHSALLAFKLMESTERPNVAVLLPPCAGFAASFYAILLAGKAAVPLNFHDGAARLEKIVEEARVDTVLTSALFERIVPSSVANGIFLERPNVSTEHYKSVPDFPERDETDVAAIFFGNAGGKPKGVRLTHEELLAARRGFVEAVDFEVEDVAIGAMTNCDAKGLASSLLMSNLSGAKCVLMARFDPQLFLTAAERHKATVLCLEPEQIRPLAEAKSRLGGGHEGHDLKAVRAALSAGALPRGAIEEFEAAFAVPIIEVNASKGR